MRLSIIFIVLFLLSACAIKQNASFNKGDSLAQFYCQGTKKGETEIPTSSALYQEMQICLMKKEYEPAVKLFSLAGALSWYHAANNNEDNFKQKEGQLLRHYLSSVPAANIQHFWIKAHQILGSPERRDGLCAQLSPLRIAIEERYLPRKAISWQEALASYLYC